MKLAILNFLFLFCFSVSYSQVSKDTTFIYFPFNSDNLEAEAKQELESFLEVFQNEPSQLTIYGHCDNKGSDEYNDQLSLRRTTAVKTWLIANGVQDEFISLVQGFGKRNPINNNANEEERSLNRRVEIIFDIMPVKPPSIDTIKTFSQKAIETISEGDKLVLPQINFQGGLHRFMPSSLSSLKELLNVMKTYPGLEIEIQGHICCRPGRDEDGIDLETNQFNLSENRAKAVYEYLWENGIDKKRMRYKGMAGKYPIVSPERTEQDKTRNRRVEIVILKK